LLEQETFTPSHRNQSLSEELGKTEVNIKRRSGDGLKVEFLDGADVKQIA